MALERRHTNASGGGESGGRVGRERTFGEGTNFCTNCHGIGSFLVSPSSQKTTNRVFRFAPHQNVSTVKQIGVRVFKLFTLDTKWRKKKRNMNANSHTHIHENIHASTRFQTGATSIRCRKWLTETGHIIAVTSHCRYTAVLLLELY